MGTAPRPSTVLVLTGGDPVPPSSRPVLPAADVVVAADSGLEHAVTLGLRADVVVGDFDSVDPAVLAAAEAGGAVVHRHPAAKDHTDLELALRVAADLRPQRIVVAGGAGGRFDHELGNVLLLCSDEFAGVDVDGWVGAAHVTVVRSRRTLHGGPGDLVSLLPVGGPATGVRTTGLLYPLAGDDLGPGTTRGVSNELVANEATVEIGGGVLLAVQPGATGTHLAARAARAAGGRR